MMTGAAVRAEVDLTPVESSYELDGAKLSNVLFRDGEQQITYNPPHNWRLSGSGPRLTLVPNATANADAHVEVKALNSALPFEEANVKKYIDNARLTLPREARDIETLRTQLNPLKICGHETLAVELQYDAFGVTYRVHLLYLNRDRQQWVFRFSAPASSFERTYEPFRASLYSLTGL
jgi:hypothetical protein